MNTQEPLVPDESPKVVENTLGSTIFSDDPVLTICNLESLIWLEKVVFHLNFIEGLESSDN